jgi:hypothetical protein
MLGVANPFTFYLLFADGVARAVGESPDLVRSQPSRARRRRPGGAPRRGAGPKS